jgi:hypothetical protein
MKLFSDNLTSIPPKNLRPFLSQLFFTTQQHFPEKIPSTPNFPEKIIISPESQSSEEKNKFLVTLLSHKSNPKSALKFFHQVERKRGFVKTVDFISLLIHILSSNAKTCGSLQYLLNNYVFGDATPSAKVFMVLNPIHGFLIIC